MISIENSDSEVQVVYLSYASAYSVKVSAVTDDVIASQ